MYKSLFISVFYSGIILVSLIFLPSLLLPKKITFFGGKLMGIWSKICLRYLLNVNVEVIGKENIINNEKFFIACTHQSAFETYFLQVIFDCPIFILKKELTQIPIFGWYLKKIGSISIDRNKVSKENLGFMEKIKTEFQSGYGPIVIFPQGTRVSVNDRTPFKKGVARIYRKLNVKCQPVVLNSGSIWPKQGKLARKKTLYVSILKPIDHGLDESLFLDKLQNNIFEELDRIV